MVSICHWFGTNMVVFTPSSDGNSHNLPCAKIVIDGNG